MVISFHRSLRLQLILNKMPAIGERQETVPSPAGSPPLKQARHVSSTGDGVDKSVILQFAKLTEHAFTPTRGSKLAAGYDLYRYKQNYLYNNFRLKEMC